MEERFNYKFEILDVVAYLIQRIQRIAPMQLSVLVIILMRHEESNGKIMQIDT